MIGNRNRIQPSVYDCKFLKSFDFMLPLWF